jgi:glycosyltransferase involved in cell wall biosynthesis
MTKKILIFALVYYPNPIGGGEVAIKEITDRMDEKDVEFHIVTLLGDSTLPRFEKMGNVNVHRIGFGKKNPSMADFAKFPIHYSKYYYQLFAGLHAYMLHKKYKFDGVWTMMPHSAGIPTSIFNMLAPRVKIALTLQEGDPIEYIEKSVKPLWYIFVRVFHKATVVQAISSYLGDWSRARGFDGPLEIIYNGANERDFEETLNLELLEQIKSKINKKEGETILVTTSRLVEKNAIDDVIKALSLLPQSVRFVICGGGELDEYLKNLTKELDLENRVMFVGNVSREETPIYRKLSDIFVRPSRSEGLGNSFASAMAARMPIIATQEGGIAEFLFDEIRNSDKKPTGYAVDKDSPEQIAEKVKYIITNPDNVKKVTENAYELVLKEYRWENIAKSMREKVFARIIN